MSILTVDLLAQVGTDDPPGLLGALVSLLTSALKHSRSSEADIPWGHKGLLLSPSELTWLSKCVGGGLHRLKQASQVTMQELQLFYGAATLCACRTWLSKCRCAFEVGV